MELGAFDEVEVVLAPFGTPVRMIESRALDLGVIMGEMHDELIGTRSKRLENFLVCVEPLGLRDAGPRPRTASRTMPSGGNAGNA